MAGASVIADRRLCAAGIKKQKPRRQAYSAEYKLKIVREALERPVGQRIKPTCRDYPDIEPVQLRKWIRNLAALEQAVPTAKCLASSRNSPTENELTRSTPPSPPTAISTPLHDYDFNASYGFQPPLPHQRAPSVMEQHTSRSAIYPKLGMLPPHMPPPPQLPPSAVPFAAMGMPFHMPYHMPYLLEQQQQHQHFMQQQQSLFQQHHQHHQHHHQHQQFAPAPMPMLSKPPVQQAAEDLAAQELINMATLG